MTMLRVALLWIAVAVTGAVPAAPRDWPTVAEAPSPPKPSGPIDLSYRIAVVPREGEPVVVEITAQASESAEWRLETAVSGVDAVVADVRVAAELVDGRRWLVSVVAYGAQPVYLTAVATARIEGVEQSRSVVVPVRSAASRTAERQPLAVDRERLILLPVEEVSIPAR